jgi:hypothetical protein
MDTFAAIHVYWQHNGAEELIDIYESVWLYIKEYETETYRNLR